MGCASSRPDTAALALKKKALAPPPFPAGHKLLTGLARSLDLEYGERKEAEAVATWVTLELEARPPQHFDEMGITLQTATQFVADVEAAVKDGVVTVQQLCEIWECPVPEGLVKVVGLSQVSLGDISKATTKGPPKDDDDDSLDADGEDAPDSVERMLGGEGDGRYS